MAPASCAMKAGARALFVSPNTLKSHIKSIYRKLDMSSRADAVRGGEARGML